MKAILILVILVGVFYQFTNFKNKQTSTPKKTKVTTDLNTTSPVRADLIQTYKDLLVLQHKNEIIRKYQLWRNADFRLRREVKLNNPQSIKQNNDSANNERKQFVKEHFKRRSEAISRLVEACESRINLKKESKDYLAQLQKELP